MRRITPILATVLSVLLVAGVVNAVTTISTSIDTDGNLTVAGTSSFGGNVSFADGVLLDLSAILHDDTVVQGLILPNAASATPSSPASGEGYLAWDTGGNQLITYNGTSWTAVGGSISIGDAIGSSTAGSILFVDSSTNLAQDNANLFWNNTNDRLGIGTTSPSFPLDVTGSIRSTDAFLFSDGSTQPYAASPNGFSWGVTTAVFKQTFSFGAQEADPYGLFFKSDGKKMYVLGSAGDAVNEYNLSTAWDVSTASFLQSFSVVAQESNPLDLFFKPDGKKMYVTGFDGKDVNEYNLSTAWDVSTASFLQNFSVSAQEVFPKGLFFKPDGKKMYVIGVSLAVKEYDLSTAWDVSTASFLQSFSVSAQELSPTDLFFKPDGKKMYVIGDGGDDVNEYDLSTSWDVSTASFLQNFSVSAQESAPRDLFFKPDGKKMYVPGAFGDDVYEYDLGLAILGNVSVGTALDTVRQYMQIDAESGAPPAGDCDADAEAGRMIVDTSGLAGAHKLYICTGATNGWDSVTLSD